VAAAERFFSRATRQLGAPRVITLDGYAASHRAVAELKAAGTLARRIRIRSSQYVNNVIEQDHRRIKQRIGADAPIQAIRGFLVRRREQARWSTGDLKQLLVPNDSNVRGSPCHRRSR
jgi:hypothetical protein